MPSAPTRGCYLDHATLGRPTPGTLDSVQRAMRKLLQFQHPGTQQTLKMFESVESARRRIAEFVHASPADILLVENTSRGLGLVASSLPLDAGDNVLIGNLEFMGAPLAFRVVSRNKGVEVRAVRSAGGRLLVEHFAALADHRTRAIVVSCVQEVDGYRTALPALSELARSLGAFLIADGIQEVGALPVDLGSGYIDAYAAGGHKWLRSPFGLGFLYVHPRLLDSLQPPAFGYMALAEPPGGWGQYMESPGRTPFDPIPERADVRRLESGGVPNWFGAIALDHAVGELQQVGAANIWNRIHRLRERLVGGLEELGVRVVAYEDRNKAHAVDTSGIVCFSLPGGLLAERPLLEELTASEIYVSLRYVCGVGGIRVSMHYDNTEEDIDQLVDVTRRFLR